MNNYEDWAHLVARKLKGEADVIAAIDKDELDDAAAAEAFVRTVLKPFLPENYGIGAGRIVDAFGNRSDYMDVVIYNRSFPRIGLRGTQSDYLYESVLASFVVRAKYLRKTFFESMDACASMARLMTNVDKTVLVQLARRNGLKPGPNKTFVHEDPLRTARFELIGSPPAFMFGFTGFKHSYRQLQENVELWIEQRLEEDPELPMRAFPAVIATQGCFAWRNAAPLALSNREMMGIGTDQAPIRLIVLQLLYLLNRRLNVTTDGYGLKPNLSAYLGQFSAPKFELGIGDVDKLVSLRIADHQKAEAEQKKRLQTARDHAPGSSARQSTAGDSTSGSTSEPDTSPVQQAAASASAAMSKQPSSSADAPAGGEPVKSAESSGVFDKPSPFASAPKPAAEKPASAQPPARPPVATLGSAPIPTMTSAPKQDDAPARPPVNPLGSAPIPESQPAAVATPPKPPVDIEVTGDIEVSDEAAASEPPDFESTMIIAPETRADAGKDDDTPVKAPPDFESTMVITPDASLSNKASENSTEAFIDRVKEQLSGSDKSAEDKDDSFASTVPH